MTISETNNKDCKKTKKTGIQFFSLFSIIVLLYLSFFISQKINEYVMLGLYLCFGSIVGNIFPFMIITDYIEATADFTSAKKLRRLFERIFKINSDALGVFIIGITCGFPMGTKSSISLYKNGIISKDECERLMTFTNNISPAFLISGIGASMLSSPIYGAVIYISVFLSAIMTGLLLGIGKRPTQKITNKQRGKFNLADSIKNASFNTLSVCGTITFFSIVTGLINEKSDEHFSFIPMLFLEFSNASLLVASTNFTELIKVMLISFSVAFSGVSVYLQSLNFIKGTDIDGKMYLKGKLLQGLLCSLCSFVIFILTKNLL